MRTDSSVTVRRSEYKPFSFDIARIHLEFDLSPFETRVYSKMTVTRRENIDIETDLVLDGEDLNLVSLCINGTMISPSGLILTDHSLTIKDVPDAFTLEIISLCHPLRNTSLMGLYVSGKSLFTQCEAEGFRKICWYADRPDVMSEFSVTIRADKENYPVLLSNGNLLSTRILQDQRHEAHWHDPFPKPAYLFALVAGTFACREQKIFTKSGREVLLQIYSDPGAESQTSWAMESLIRSVRWDEDRFGLELDLDRFMIVAARDFNMGAMENKGLNIFNSAYVLADPDIATDANYQAIEAVIGHEYFHNWTGNRVTCRDWFQLSLKEGLTVFRDQEFTADMMAKDLSDTQAESARTIKRIDDVVALRNAQFPEDSGPMAHPIRPESYQEIGNFYTATVYEKGAEVIRMLHTLLGEQCFQRGMTEYFHRHDGQAVTCDDFINAMEFAYQKLNTLSSLDIFRRWYSQAGTPRVSVSLAYDETNKSCAITLAQTCPAVGVEKQSGIIKKAFHIPIKFGLIDASGRAIGLREKQNSPQKDSVLLELTEAGQTWHFSGIDQAPVPSILRDFSAPVIIDYKYSKQELALLSGADTNAFARWEAGQELASAHILEAANHWRQSGSSFALDEILSQAWLATATEPALDAGYRARALSLPAEKSLLEKMNVLDAFAVSVARRELTKQLGRSHHAILEQLYFTNISEGTYRPDPKSAGQRALKNLALGLMMAEQKPAIAQLANKQFRQANNMTDRLAALTCLAHEPGHGMTHDAMSDFYENWQHQPLVIDKWFAVQATAPDTDADTVRALMSHPAFTLKNPNRARSVIFSFCMQNSMGLHATDGSGYAFWVEQVLALDAINPEIAARLARALDSWARFIPQARKLMYASLEQVAGHSGLSRNTLEIVTKALAL